MFTLIVIVAAVTFLVLWRDEVKSGEKKRQAEYERGYSAGYWGLADRLKRALFSSPDSFDIDVLKTEIRLTSTDESLGQKADTSQQSVSTSSLSQTFPTTTSSELPNHLPTESELLEQAKRDSVRNMNIMLFVASLLFVAAGAAFVTTAMPEFIKLLGIWLLVVMFYVTGLSLQDSDKFRPAGVAFAGTGLGLLPFAGLVLNRLTDISGDVVWLLTSFIGIIMFYYAAIALRSQVVSYLALAFVISFAASLSDVVALPLVWSFVSVIVAALVINVIAFVKPGAVPDVFAKPVEQSGQIVTPLTLLMSLFFLESLSVRSYELLAAVGIAYYVVAWLQTKQDYFIQIIRALAQVLLLLIVWDVSDMNATALGIGVVVSAILQQLVSFIVSKKGASQGQWLWIGSMQSAMFVAPALWVGSGHFDSLLAIDYLLIGAMSLAAAMRFRQASALVPAVVVSILLPFIVGRLLLEPALSWGSLAAWFIVSATCILAGRLWFMGAMSKSLSLVLDASHTAYLSIAFVLALAVDDGVAAALFVAIAFLFWVSSYVTRQKAVSVFGSIAWIVSVYKFVVVLSVPLAWQPLLVWALAGAVLYAGYWYVVSRKDEERAVGLLGAFWVLGFSAVTLSFFAEETEVLAALSIVAIAATVAVEGRRQHQDTIVEVAGYIATFGLQRLLGITSEGVSMVFYAHWWAATIFAMGQWRKQGEGRTQVALAFVTASSGLYALAEGGVYQLLFLVEHVALLIAGAVSNRRWATVWGLVGSILAVLWFLKDILFVAFAFLGLVVIGVVVWRLKNSDDSDANGDKHL